MKLFSKLLAVVLCMTVIACSAVMLSVLAEEDSFIEKVDGIRWFPVPENRQNDDAWEVECIADGCLCQRFTETAEDTGNSNYLDTEYTAEGGLKLSRNDATIIMGDVDYTERYWPRIRTLSLETSPELDIKTANTLYFDVEVAEGTEWNMSLAINGMNISFAKFMAAAGGASLDPMDTSIVDAPAGRFKGSVNLTEIIDQIAGDSKQLDSSFAQALKNMKVTFVPQIQIYCVGGKDANLTIHELFLTSADDTAGEKCTFVDMGLLSGLGEDYYDLLTDEIETEPTESETEATEPAADDETTTTAKATTTTTKAAEKSEGGFPVVPVVIGVAVVAVVAIVVVIVSKKK